MTSPCSTARPANGASAPRTPKSEAPAWSQRNGHSGNAKPTGAARNGSSLPRGPRTDSRSDNRSAGSRKPALIAGAKAPNTKRFGFAARPKPGTKKRG